MKVLAAAALAVVFSGSLQAQVMLSDSFDGEGTAGTSTLSYNAFANWDVIGNVDLVQDGNFSIDCDVKCVDLDGTPGPGSIRTKQAFNLMAGDTWTFAFSISGSQRSANADNIFLNALFGGSPVTGAFSGTGGFASNVIPGFGQNTAVGYSTTILGAAPFSTWSMTFEVQTAGTVQFELGTESFDNVGPLIDDVLITRRSTQVPEPTSAALLLLGLGSLGFTARRRSMRR